MAIFRPVFRTGEGLRGAWRDHCFPAPFFLIFTRNRPSKSEDHLCRLFFIEMSKKRLEKKRKNTASFMASLGAGVQPRLTVQLFIPVSVVEKMAIFAVCSRLRGVIWRGKAFREQQCQFLTGNKSFSRENESNCSITSECVRTGSIFSRGAGREGGRCKQPIFSLSIFGILAEQLSF